MKRSTFLKIPLIRITFSLQAQFKQKNRPKKGFKVEAGKERFIKESTSQSISNSALKLYGKYTNSDLLIY